jgi:hypothetical protein
VCCPACGAPLQLPDEPALPRLDCALDLDRRSLRTPVPTSGAAPRDDGDLGDLSFDAPSDDGPWTLSAAAPGEPEPGLGPDPQAGGDELEPRLGRSPGADRWSDAGLELSAEAAGDDPDAELDASPDDEDDCEDDCDDEEPAASPGEHVAVVRGKMLSLASLAVAGAAALVAVLSSR